LTELVLADVNCWPLEFDDDVLAQVAVLLDDAAEHHVHDNPGSVFV